MRGLAGPREAAPADLEIVCEVPPERPVRRDAPVRAVRAPGERVELGLVPLVEAVEDEVLVQPELLAPRPRAVGEARPERVHQRRDALADLDDVRGGLGLGGRLPERPRRVELGPERVRARRRGAPGGRDSRRRAGRRPARRPVRTRRRASIPPRSVGLPPAPARRPRGGSCLRAVPTTPAPPWGAAVQAWRTRSPSKRRARGDGPGRPTQLSAATGGFGFSVPWHSPCSDSRA